MTLKLHQMLIDAILNNDFVLVEELLPKVDIHFNDEELLRTAAKVGNFDLAKKLIEEGCDPSSRNWEVLENAKILKWLLPNIPPDVSSPRAMKLRTRGVPENYIGAMFTLLFNDDPSGATAALTNALATNNKSVALLLYPYGMLNTVDGISVDYNFAYATINGFQTIAKELKEYFGANEEVLDEMFYDEEAERR